MVGCVRAPPSPPCCPRRSSFRFSESNQGLDSRARLRNKRRTETFDPHAARPRRSPQRLAREAQSPGADAPSGARAPVRRPAGGRVLSHGRSAAHGLARTRGRRDRGGDRGCDRSLRRASLGGDPRRTPGPDGVGAQARGPLRAGFGGTGAETGPAGARRHGFGGGDPGRRRGRAPHPRRGPGARRGGDDRADRRAAIAARLRTARRDRAGVATAALRPKDEAGGPGRGGCRRAAQPLAYRSGAGGGGARRTGARRTEMERAARTHARRSYGGVDHGGAQWRGSFPCGRRTGRSPA